MTAQLSAADGSNGGAGSAADSAASTANSGAAAAPSAEQSAESSAGALLSKQRPSIMVRTLDQVDLARKVLGIENRELELPGIVVIGGQSAGKSSVVEALSGISLPRRDPPCLFALPSF